MIYVTADLHGDAARLKEPAVKKLGRRDTLIVLGDFGFLWSGSKAEQKTLRWIGRRRCRVLFLDGAHENFDLLAACPEEDFEGGRARHITGRLWYLQRGEIYTLEGRRFLVFGGGESEDPDNREEGKTWWSAELPTPAELAHCRDSLEAAGHRVDYILTHTPPVRLRRSLLGETAEVNCLETFLDEVQQTTEYRCWYFGRFHIDRALGPRAAAVYRRVLPLWKPEKKRLFRRADSAKAPAAGDAGEPKQA